MNRVEMVVGTAGEVAVVRVSGDVDSETAGSVEQTLRGQLGTAGGLIVDLLGVGFLASAGLNTLVVIHQEAVASGTPFAVVAVQHAVLRPIEVLGLDGTLTVRGSVEEARAEITG